MHKLWCEEELCSSCVHLAGPACCQPLLRCWLTHHPPCCLLQVETIRSNVIGCLNLADVTNQKGLHMTYYGTGCIFHYDDEFPQGSGKGFKESDKPNFTGSYYSYTKVGGLGMTYPCFWKGPAQQCLGTANVNSCVAKPIRAVLQDGGTAYCLLAQRACSP